MMRPSAITLGRRADGRRHAAHVHRELSVEPGDVARRVVHGARHEDAGVVDLMSRRPKHFRHGPSPVRPPGRRRPGRP